MLYIIHSMYYWGGSGAFKAGPLSRDELTNVSGCCCLVPTTPRNKCCWFNIGGCCGCCSIGGAVADVSLIAAKKRLLRPLPELGEMGKCLGGP